MSDPFECPRCGERDVTVSGGGRKDCGSCSWSYRPKPEITTEQAGLGDYAGS